MKRTTFELPLRIARGDGQPLRQQLLRELREAVQSGRLAAGTWLPSTRALAADLGLSRGLIVEAYEQLVAEGYLVAHRGSGTRVVSRRPLAPLEDGAPRIRPVAPDGQSAAQEPRFDFRPGIPDVSLFPKQAWLRALRRALIDEPAAALDYPQPPGVAPARWALAGYLNRSRATVADAEGIVLCTGFAQGIRLVGEALRARGALRLAVEDPGHVERCADVRQAGIELVPVPIDSGGMCVDRLPHLDVHAVLVTPAHQYPTGAVLDPERRLALLEWAARDNRYVLEDDYDAEYRYDRAPVGALQGLAPDRVVYFGSASKMLAPSLRQGWVVLPLDLVDDVRRAKRSADRGSPVLEQLALAAFIAGGDLDRHLRRTRRHYRRRRDLLIQAMHRRMPEAVTRGAAAGLHLLLELPVGTDEAGVVALAAQHGIWLHSARDYYAEPTAAHPALLLGYGGMPEQEIEAGVEALTGVIREAMDFRRS